MGSIEKRGRRYRAKYRDPLGRQGSKTFTLKADAERFVREMVVGVERGAWLDPRDADLALASWVAEFLALARRLPPTTVQTCRRDLEKYVCPASAPTGSAASRPMRSRTGSTTRSQPASPRARFAVTTARCGVFSRWRSRSRRSRPICAIGCSLRASRNGTWPSCPGMRRSPWPKPTRIVTGR